MPDGPVLSRGAIVGIAIGSLIVFILLIALIWYVRRRILGTRRGRVGSRIVDEQSLCSLKLTKEALAEVQEADDTAVIEELDSTSIVREIDGTAVYELEARPEEMYREPEDVVLMQAGSG